MLRCVVESVRSRCRREVTSVEREGREQAARDLEVGLGVLEADRVDLVRHRRRAGRAGDGDLREVAERDVRPHVGGEIVQDAAGVPHAVVELDLPVVRLDLGRQRVEADAQPLDERARERRPVDVGVGGEVRRPGAGRARELGQVLGCRHLRRDALEAPDEHGELLAHGRRRGRLAVRAGEHRGIAMLLGQRAQRRRSRARSFGSHTVVTARWTVSAYEAELMSSLVHAKCVSSAIESSPSADSRSRTRYSTAFTSCRVTASFSASQSISAWPKSRYSARRRSLSASGSGDVPNSERSVSAMSHSTSTSTRARLRPASER